MHSCSYSKCPVSRESTLVRLAISSPASTEQERETACRRHARASIDFHLSGHVMMRDPALMMQSCVHSLASSIHPHTRRSCEFHSKGFQSEHRNAEASVLQTLGVVEKLREEDD
mmetsp:Transcript_20649/g.57376  ORF Transcript_20649/g.57376 Transcript_20649/m.57376 type:complete len:114 (+) Transcript_20649:1574-1915(+)